MLTPTGDCLPRWTGGGSGARERQRHPNSHSCPMWPGTGQPPKTMIQTNETPAGVEKANGLDSEIIFDIIEVKSRNYLDLKSFLTYRVESKYPQNYDFTCTIQDANGTEIASLSFKKGVDPLSKLDFYFPVVSGKIRIIFRGIIDHATFSFWSKDSSGSSALLGYVERVIIPVGKTSPFKTVNEDAFKGASRLIEIPENIFEHCVTQTSFNSLFQSCWKLTSIPANLFKNCINLAEVISCFSDCITVTEIPGGLFSNNTKLTRVNMCFSNSLYIDNYINLKYVPSDLFDNCPSIVWAAHCFSGNVNIVTALPPLWQRGTITAHLNYAYQCTKATNYASIPADWK